MNFAKTGNDLENKIMVHNHIYHLLVTISVDWNRNDR
jgi:hypothetical protein